MPLSGYNYLERLDLVVKTAFGHYIYNVSRPNFTFRSDYENVGYKGVKSDEHYIAKTYCDGDVEGTTCKNAVIVWYKNDTGTSLTLKIGPGTNHSSFFGNLTEAELDIYYTIYNSDGSVASRSRWYGSIPLSDAVTIDTVAAGQYLVIEWMGVDAKCTDTSSEYPQPEGGAKNVLEMWLEDSGGTQHYGVRFDGEKAINQITGGDLEKEVTIEVAKDEVFEQEVGTVTTNPSRDVDMKIYHTFLQGDHTYFVDPDTGYEGLKLIVTEYDASDAEIVTYTFLINTSPTSPEVDLTGEFTLFDNCAKMVFKVKGKGVKTGTVKLKYYVNPKIVWI